MAPSEIQDFDIAATLDHTLLIPAASADQITQWCTAAEHYHFPTVCVPPCYVRQAVEHLYNSPIQVTTVIDFPLGTSPAAVKLYQAQTAVEMGAAELDVKLNLCLFKNGDLDGLNTEIAQIVEETGVPVKAILETALLTDQEKQQVAEVCIDAGVAYLMTSTGWTQGATAADVRLLWEITQGSVGVKASGGINTVEKAIQMLEAGATRLGTSYGVELMDQMKAATLPTDDSAS